MEVSERKTFEPQVINATQENQLETINPTLRVKNLVIKVHK